MNPEEPTYGAPSGSPGPEGDFRPGFLSGVYDQEPAPLPPPGGWQKLEHELHGRKRRPGGLIWLVAALLLGLGAVLGIYALQSRPPAPLASGDASYTTRSSEALPAGRASDAGEAERGAASTAQPPSTDPAQASNSTASNPSPARNEARSEEPSSNTSGSVERSAAKASRTSDTQAAKEITEGGAQPASASMTAPATAVAPRRRSATRSAEGVSPAKAKGRSAAPSSNTEEAGSSVAHGTASAAGATPVRRTRRPARTRQAEAKKAVATRHEASARARHASSRAEMNAPESGETATQDAPASTASASVPPSTTASDAQAITQSEVAQPIGTQPEAARPAAATTQAKADTVPTLAQSTVAKADSVSAKKDSLPPPAKARQRRLILEAGAHALLRERNASLESRADAARLRWDSPKAPTPGVEVFGAVGCRVGKVLAFGAGLGLGGWQERLAVTEQGLATAPVLAQTGTDTYSYTLPYAPSQAQSWSWLTAQAHTELWLRLAPPRVPVSLQAGPSLDILQAWGGKGPEVPTGTRYLPGLAAQLRYAPGRFFIEGGVRHSGGTAFTVPGYYRLRQQFVTFGVGYSW